MSKDKEAKKNKSKGTLADNLSQHKIKLAIVCVIGFLTLMSVGTYIFYRFNQCVNIIETAYYFSQIIAALFVVLGTALALIQYTNSCNEKRKDRVDIKKSEAGKLAKTFCEEAIPKINDLISYLKYDGNEINEIANKLKETDLRKFNREEIQKLFPDYKPDILLSHITKEYYKKKNNKEKIGAEDNDELISLFTTINNKCIEVANVLEYYAIMLNADIVDNDTVYQSIHGVYLDVVRFLYIIIFYSNTSDNNSERLYYNISELYMKWNNTSKKNHYEEKKKKEEIYMKYHNELDNIDSKSIVVSSKE